MKQNGEGIPQSVLREIAALKALQRFNHPNLTRFASPLNYSSNTFRLYDAFLMKSASGEGISLNVVFEKCDWDLYEFLQKIPRDMPELQCRTFARQVLFTLIDVLTFLSSLDSEGR